MADAKKIKVVTIRLSEPVYEALAEIAKADRRKLATFLALALEDYLAARERALALRKKR